MYAIIFLLIGLMDTALMVGLNKLITLDLAMDNSMWTIVSGTMAFVVIVQFFDSTSSCIHGIIRGLER